MVAGPQEAPEVVRRLWTAACVTFHAQHVHVHVSLTAATAAYAAGPQTCPGASRRSRATFTSPPVHNDAKFRHFSQEMTRPLWSLCGTFVFILPTPWHGGSGK